MNIAIVTMHRVRNYGSVWQTYALIKQLEKLGHSVQIVDYIQPRFRYKQVFRGKSNLNFPKKIYKFFRIAIDVVIFRQFLKKYIPLTRKKYYSMEELLNDLPQAEVYMTGSDQVWNTYYNGFVDPVFFVDFAPAGSKRVAYAASFGKDRLDSEEVKKIKDLINKYDALSVRELSAMTILEEMGRNDGLHLIDPTFLLDKQEWEKIAGKNKTEEKYLLIYSIEGRENLIEYASRIAEARNIKIYTIEWGFKKIKGCDKTLNFRTPREFLSLFTNADFVVTNSFHGTAFSINLNKQFLSVPHPVFNSRLLSILQIMGLSNRMVCGDFEIDEVLKPIDYESVNAKIGKERHKAMKYLEHVLHK